jgi:hypothetical protein
VAVYDPASASGRMLALDLDVSRGDVDRQAAELGQLLERLGGRYVADVAPSGGRHVYVLFAAALPWLELRDLVRAIALRFAAVDPAPHASLGGQISPPGSRHKSGGWRLLTMPADSDHPAEIQRLASRPGNGGPVGAGLACFAAREHPCRIGVFRRV